MVSGGERNTLSLSFLGEVVVARFTEEKRVEVWDRWLTNRTRRCSGGSAIAFSANSPMDRLVREKTDAASSIHFVVMLLALLLCSSGPKTLKLVWNHQGRR